MPERSRSIGEAARHLRQGFVIAINRPKYRFPRWHCRRELKRGGIEYHRRAAYRADWSMRRIYRSVIPLVWRIQDEAERDRTQCYRGRGYFSPNVGQRDISLSTRQSGCV